MQIRYRLTTLKNARAAAAVHRCFPVIRRLRRASVAAFCVGLVAPFVGYPSLAISLLGLSTVVYTVLGSVGFVQGLFAWAGSRPTHQEQVVDLTAEGLVLRGTPANSEVSWEAVTAVIPRKRFIVLLFGPWSGVAIPRKRLDDVPDEALLGRLRAREGWPALSHGAPGSTPLVAQEGELLTRFSPSVDLLTAASHDITWKTRIGLMNLLVLGGLWTVVGFVPWLWAVLDPDWSAWLQGFLMSMMGVVFVWSLLGAPRLQAKRALLSPLARGEDQQTGVSPTGLRTRGPLSNVELTWDAISRTLETDRFFLAFFSKTMALYIPKEEMTPEDLGLHRELFAAHSDFNDRRDGESPRPSSVRSTSG